MKALDAAQSLRNDRFAFVPVLFRMEKTGVSIDSAVLNKMSVMFGAEIERVGEEIFASRNIGSIFSLQSNSATCSSTRWACPSR